MTPLPPIRRTSVIIAPVAVALPAIRDAMERATPRDLSGKPDNQLGKVLSKTEIGFTVARSPLAVNGGANGLTLSTSLNGALRVTGQVGSQAANLGDTITGLINDNLGRKVESFAGKAFDQRADFRGNVAVTSRPAIATNWRIEPNLTAQVSMGDEFHFGRRAQAQCHQGNQAAARPRGERADRRLAGAAAHRSVPRKRRAQRVGQDVPLDPARRRRQPACPSSGSNYARPVPSRHSRASTRTRSR